jgi:enoyl-CoA hydratase
VLELEIDDSGVAVLSLNKPPANTFDEVAVAQLDGVLDELEAAPALKAVILQSRTPMFSAGADIGMIDALAEQVDGAQRLAAFAARFQRVLRRVRRLPLCTIAAITGPATGGGFELALSCDLRIAGVSARCGLPEIRLGLIPAAGGTQMLSELAGRATALRLILTGELLSGGEAKEAGLVQFVTPDSEVEILARRLAMTIARWPKAAIAANKRCIALAGTEQGFDAEIAGTQALHADPETRSLVRGFLQSRRDRLAPRGAGLQSQSGEGAAT